MTQIRLTQGAFKVWLTAHGASRVGRACNEFDCPVANFLRDHGYPEAAVFDNVWYSDQPMLVINKHRLPRWAQTLIEHVDAVDEYDYTGYEVLGLLQRALPALRIAA